ncbi:hypothetical protein QJS04_geneDACA004839 [Acorus gramineus]|uniref:CCAAT-binding factor domain-containing protein n=1 Tax=Acorus gramineus TaxID=55184 RepID=A0AAV9BU92_ACOGR|nr:hypothetical protein QJS04_geneDACA004839 [Acorus gramineus]
MNRKAKISKPVQNDGEDVDLLKSEVASFASSLGLAAPSNDSGFDDSDFRKTGPIKPSKNSRNPPSSTKPSKPSKPTKLEHSKPSAKPQKKIDPFKLAETESDAKGAGLPKLPLIKADALLGQWYETAAELESKTLTGALAVPTVGIERQKVLAAEKKEMGRRLLDQYSREYQISKGRTTGVKLLYTSLRSGTSKDKVNALMSMVTSKVGKRYALDGFEALKVMFVKLLPDRKLKFLMQRPLENLSETKDGFSLLLFWYWEECLKERYSRFVVALEEASKDMLPILKDKAVKTIYFLLENKPELEHKLLSALVNKLGDPERKAASCAEFRLSCLLSKFPNMKAVVIREVHSFIFRPHVGLRAKYYAVLISEASGDKKTIESNKKEGAKFKKDSQNKKEGSEESNVEMDSRLLSALLTPEMFLGLLVKAMKIDVNLKRVSAFSKRLLQVALQQPPQYACGCLFILSEVLKARPPLWSVALQNEAIDDDLEHFEDIIEVPENVASDSLSGDPASSISLININNGPKTSGDSSDSNDEEELHESYSEDDNSSVEDIMLAGDNSNEVKCFKPKTDKGIEQVSLPNMSSLPGGYDPRHREPAYCNADRASWWELLVLASHVHPSVATMAQTLLSGANIVYNGDPLKDLCLGAFLDKFMEKKAKPNRKWHGGSDIAPAKKLDMNKHLIGPEILMLAEDEVPPEDLVFHKYYMNKSNSEKKLKKKKKVLGDEAVEELLGGDDESDEDIDSAMGLEHMPVEDEGDYDYDNLDRIAEESDEDLVRGGSDDDDMESAPLKTTDPSEDDGEDFDMDAMLSGDDDDDEPSRTTKRQKRKSGGRDGGSVFASLEEYEHLLKDGDHGNGNENESKRRKRRKKAV